MDNYNSQYLSYREIAYASLKEAITGLPDSPVSQAMAYSAFNTGKMLRPVLLLAVYDAMGGEEKCAAKFAAAIEMIHTYSLIHDDLPAMDNDDLRRGKPSNHVNFGEANAILAGDGLLTLGFEMMADAMLEMKDASWGARATSTVARCAGSSGMIMGQAFDMNPDIHVKVERIHELKTGMLFAAAARAGAELAGADLSTAKDFDDFGIIIGKAFQITDDILDVTATMEKLGKTPGKDAEQNKNSVLSSLSMEAALLKAKELVDDAAFKVKKYDPSGFIMQYIQGIVDRKY